MIEPLQGLVTNLTEARFSVRMTGEEEAGDIRCRLDHFVFQACGGEVHYRHLEEGTHTIAVRTMLACVRSRNGRP